MMLSDNDNNNGSVSVSKTSPWLWWTLQTVAAVLWFDPYELSPPTHTHTHFVSCLGGRRLNKLVKSPSCLSLQQSALIHNHPNNRSSYIHKENLNIHSYLKQVFGSNSNTRISLSYRLSLCCLTVPSVCLMPTPSSHRGWLHHVPAATCFFQPQQSCKIPSGVV